MSYFYIKKIPELNGGVLPVPSGESILGDGAWLKSLGAILFAVGGGASVGIGVGMGECGDKKCKLKKYKKYKKIQKKLE